MFSLRRLRSFAWGCVTVCIFTMGILFALSVVLGASISDVHRSLPTALLADNPGASSDTDAADSTVGEGNEPPLAVTVTIEFQLPDEAAEATAAASGKVSATPPTLLVSASSTPTLVDQDLDLALPSQGNVGGAGAGANLNLNLPALTATAAAQLQGTKVQAYVKAVAATRTASVLQAAPTRRSLTATAAAWQH